MLVLTIWLVGRDARLADSARLNRDAHDDCLAWFVMLVTLVLMTRFIYDVALDLDTQIVITDATLVLLPSHG